MYSINAHTTGCEQSMLLPNELHSADIHLFGLVDPKTLPRHHPNINEGFYTLGGTFDAIFV